MSEATREPGRVSGVAVAGFIFAMVALLAAFSLRWWVLLIVVVALILSGTGITQTREDGRSGRGFAIAGLTISCIVAAGIAAILLGALRL